MFKEFIRGLVVGTILITTLITLATGFTFGVVMLDPQCREAYLYGE